MSASLHPRELRVSYCNSETTNGQYGCAVSGPGSEDFADEELALIRESEPTLWGAEFVWCVSYQVLELWLPHHKCPVIERICNPTVGRLTPWLGRIPVIIDYVTVFTFPSTARHYLPM